MPDAAALADRGSVRDGVRQRRGRPAPPERVALPLAGVVAVLAAWELAVRAGVLSPDSFPTVSDIAGELGSVLVSGGLWSAVGSTIAGWALGLAVAVAVGVPVGVLAGTSYLARRATRIPIELLRPIPSVALIPLVVLIYGTGLGSKVILAGFAASWPLLMQTLYGVRDVEPVALETARSFRLGRAERLRRVTLPSALPFIATGLRIASAVALLLSVTTELVLGAPGLGNEINEARAGGAPAQMYALIVVTGTLGWALNAVLLAVERHALRWHPSHRSAVA